MYPDLPVRTEAVAEAAVQVQVLQAGTAARAEQVITGTPRMVQAEAAEAAEADLRVKRAEQEAQAHCMAVAVEEER
jgi:hypothetical protein